MEAKVCTNTLRRSLYLKEFSIFFETGIGKMCFTRSEIRTFIVSGIFSVFTFPSFFSSFTYNSVLPTPRQEGQQNSIENKNIIHNKHLIPPLFTSQSLETNDFLELDFNLIFTK
jgi:hypothetical protein